MLYLGYDPGGKGANGVATLRTDPSGAVYIVDCDTVPTPEDAVHWFRAQANDTSPDGLGADTLTEWCTGHAGWRPADDRIRQLTVSRAVISPNRLEGAMCLNGMCVVMRLREGWPHLLLSEAHPKALWRYALGVPPDYGDLRALRDRLAAWLGVAAFNVSPSDEHAWDAIVCAFCVWRGVIGAWTEDLHAFPNGKRSPLGSLGGALVG